MFPKKSALAAAVVALVSLLFVGTAQAGFPGFPGKGDDNVPSLGSFQILVATGFQPVMVGYPGYNAGTKILTSPLLFDPSTVIGRSAPHPDGSPADSDGVMVGMANTIISDGSFNLRPDGFEGPAGTREVHTEIRTLDLAAGAVHVRAGTAASFMRVSPGEVESDDPDGPAASDFPADSFFNVFVEVTLPAVALFPGAILYNPSPLLVVEDDLTGFPPKVVYKHANTSAVLIRVLGTNEVFGYLVLAGHGVDFGTATPADVTAFEAAVAQFTPMPVQIGGIAELPGADAAPLAAPDSAGPSAGAVVGIAAAIAAGVVALGGAAWYARRRWLM